MNTAWATLRNLCAGATLRALFLKSKVRLAAKPPNSPMVAINDDCTERTRISGKSVASLYGGFSELRVVVTRGLSHFKAQARSSRYKLRNIAPRDRGKSAPAVKAIGTAIAKAHAFIAARTRRIARSIATYCEEPDDQSQNGSNDNATASPGQGSSSQPQRDLLKEWQAIAHRNLVTVAIFSLFINLLMLTLPIYLFQLSDRVLTSRSIDTLMMLSLIALAFIAMMSLLDALRRQVLNRIAVRMETLLAAPIIAGLINHAQFGQGNNIAGLRNLQQVRGFISGPVMLMLFDAPMAPIYFAAVFLIHPDLGFIAIGSGVALVVVAILNQKATSGGLTTSGQHAAKAEGMAEALARNAQVINAMGMLNEGILRWGQEQAQALSTQIGAQDRNLWISGVSKFLRLVTQIGMLGWGAYLALNSHLTGGMMIAASIIAGRALAPIEGMIEGWRSLVQTRAAYARVKAMIEATQKERPRLLLPKPKGQLSVDKLLYIVPGNKEPILNGVTFDLPAGESLAIVGPSGSGKSTIARILVGCLVPTAGRVRLDTTELRNWDRRQFGEYTGYLPQEVELFPGTIRSNIARMRDELPDSAVFEAAQMTDVHEIVCHLQNGYETVIDSNGAPLSGGQRQRIGLARAFMGEPAFVVLDEPNSNLDSAGEEALSNTIRRAKQKGITVVVITQRPALLQCVDKVLILRGGRAEAFGPSQRSATPRHAIARSSRSSCQYGGAKRLMLSGTIRT